MVRKHLFFLLKYILSVWLLLQGISHSFAQTDTLRGQIRETFSNQVLPFVHITIFPSGNEFISNIDGTFSMPHPAAGSKIIFNRFLHRTVEIEITGGPIPGDTMQVRLNRFQLFPPLPPTNAATLDIIKHTINLASENNINKHKQIQYQTYNKLTIDVGNNSHVNDLLKKLRANGWLKIDDISGNQHLYILESVATRKILNSQNQLENIDALMSSGIRIPGVAFLGTHLQHFNVYDNFVEVAGKKYISPLAQSHSINRYNYQILDTLYLKDGKYFSIAFAPKASKNFSALKGLMLIHANDYSVRYVLVSPAFQNKGLTEVTVQYKTIDHELFPDRQTIYLRGTEDVGGLSPIIQSSTWYHFYQTNKNFKDCQFNECILSYKEEDIEKDTNYWNQMRQTPATLTDKNTYTYFQNGINPLLLQKFLNLGQNIYFGKLTVGYVNFDLNKILNHNRAEGFRIGIGGTTNYRFSKIWKFSAFVGYGFGDTKFKYGLGVERMLYLPKKCAAGISFSNELQEAGGQQQAFDTPQYSSETLRRLLITYMDYTKNLMVYFKAHPITYLDYKMSFSYQHTLPNYNYVYKGEAFESINYFEWSNGIRYAFGEQEIHLNDEIIKQLSKYPILYFNIDKGFKISNQPFTYTRYEFRIDQFIKIVDLGKTGIQMVGGATSGYAPYSKLFVGKGSSKSAGVVVHNSFETMGYNEFVADRYYGLFLSHDFGRMYYRSRFFMPNFMVIYNIGWGFLSHPEYHAGPQMKDYSKGYKETGAFINNIVVLKLSGLKMGIGAGVFFRYGEYQYPKTSDNAVFKFSLNLSPGS
ncbi:DUF5686 family protein [Cytophaga hutchinsonii]|nr:DUF5686 family protein [Cytophaga hutchinsonii]SFX39460.1 hypothetical protein SAMN04487930_103322 [Cytophaga hutchinsonii ATCC 33406]